jgi:site-specific DNA recombinase
MGWAFEAYATGDWTIRQLHTAVTEKGLTSSGGPRTPSRPLSLSNLARLLRTPYYKGVVVYRGVEYPGSHEALVSAVTWDRVQAQLDAHGRSGEKQRIHNHYLKGTVFCGQCGSRLGIMNAKNRHGTVYPYFYCLGRGEKRTNCTQRVVLIDQVEDIVTACYPRVRLTLQQRADVQAFISGQLEARRADAEMESTRQGQRIERLTDERQKLLQAHYADAVPLDQLRSEQARIGKELAAAERLLDSTRANYERVVAKLEQALALAENCQAAYRAATPQVRRWMNQTFFKRVLIDDTYGAEAELAEPFGLLLHQDVLKAAHEAVTEQKRRRPAEYHRVANRPWGPKNDEPTLAFAGVGSRNDCLAWARGDLNPHVLTDTGT